MEFYYEFNDALHSIIGQIVAMFRIKFRFFSCNMITWTYRKTNIVKSPLGCRILFLTHKHQVLLAFR